MNDQPLPRDSEFEGTLHENFDLWFTEAVRMMGGGLPTPFGSDFRCYWVGVSESAPSPAVNFTVAYNVSDAP
jgi:hypothetical protein